jgi:hypothetical protein
VCAYLLLISYVMLPCSCTRPCACMRTTLRPAPYQPPARVVRTARVHAHVCSLMPLQPRVCMLMCARSCPYSHACACSCVLAQVPLPTLVQVWTFDEISLLKAKWLADLKLMSPPPSANSLVDEGGTRRPGELLKVCGRAALAAVRRVMAPRAAVHIVAAPRHALCKLRMHVFTAELIAL